MDNSKVIGAILLDLSKAFDLVNHDVFFCQTKLSVYFTSEHTMQWFKSYLSDRSQTCIILGKTSVPLPLVLGIPLGSILGPLFFPFASMICHFLYKILKLICMQMTTIWLLVIMCEITCIQQSLQEILDNANCWFSLNRMKPNAKKNKANVNWNCSNALLCRQDMHEFILVSHLESVY